MKPLLAAPTDGLNISYPVLVSAKLDGVRCIVVDGVAMSRSMKPIPNKFIQSIIGQEKLNGLDGELIIGDETAKDVYNASVSGVMSREGQPNFEFKVFDDYLGRGGFERRHHDMVNRIKKFSNHLKIHIKHVPHFLVVSASDLIHQEQVFLGHGYEGVMVRKILGDYKQGRSTAKEGILLKLKRFHDSEGLIIGCHQFMVNLNEPEINELGYKERSSKKAGKFAEQKLGAFKLRDVSTGVEFDVGTGFTDEQRTEYWANRLNLIGKLVKYKSQLIGVKDKPRFPVFLGFRDILDT